MIDDVERLLLGAMLASDARLEAEESGNNREFRMVGDPTEGALVVAAAKAELDREMLRDRYERVDEIPFDSTRKRMSTLHVEPHHEGDHVMFVKGAPDVLLDLVTHVYHDGEKMPLTPELRERIARANREMAQQALRVL
ncbi:MAG: ATPase, partial [Gammaproteobacteria bacterium]|nr:ATPase [Gammaproteobacteria bacterium]